ncbi:MAG TPA: UvrD-helicase domain-containing protein [Patescibacteria group bacterium]|nr:UvrD-helicase domain-containing protein [Patescibacteria group bacterium]
MEKDLLQNLNPEQKKAVLATEGPVLVLAGAGSGKTKALTHRIAYLIREKKVSPYNILAVTFTNKAAGEITARVTQLLNKELRIKNKGGGENPNSSFLIPDSGATRLPWAGTFHSVCVRILRREADYIGGYSRSFTIADSNDQISIIKRIMRDLNINPKDYNPNSVQHFISDSKNELIDAKEYKKYINSLFEQITAKVYDRYEKYLRETNLMDFDDLIMNCVFLFQNNPDILEKYQKLFKYILIDEYQDTNQAQYVWVKLLAAKYKNIMVVGDDYQSIYSWRGANFRNILNFEKDYKNAVVIKLEQNYRSSKTILTAANDVIKFNKNKTDKKLWTENSDGLPITVYQALNEKDEAEFVAMEIKSLVHSTQYTVHRKEYNYSDIAVLYRTNAQSRAIEETFLRFKIPYKIVGGFRFYERAEIKNIIAFLRLIYNPADFESFERAVCAVSRGIGEKTVEKIRTVILNVPLEAKNPKVISEILRENTQDDKIKMIRQAGFSSKVVDFFELLSELETLSLAVPLDRLILTIAEKSGYKAFLLDGTAEGEGRWENILELSTVAAQVEAQNPKSEIRNLFKSLRAPQSLERPKQVPNLKSEFQNNEAIEQLNNDDKETALEQFLQQVSLTQDTDQIESDGGVVTLMTLHSAKGLEFRAVFIVGVEEGLFPHSRAIMEESEMEEERRLCYVGITRAKERLYLIHAGERNLYGRFQCNEVSRFIENIPEELLDII